MRATYIKTALFSLVLLLLPASLCFGKFVTIGSSTIGKSELAKNIESNEGNFDPVEYVSFKGYQGDGSFVEAPARVGDWTGYLIALLPAIIITEPIRLVSILDYEGDDIGAYMLYGTTKFFGCLFGAPSFILKGFFYDFPSWTYSSLFGSQTTSPSRVQDQKSSIITPALQPKTDKDEDISYFRWQPEQLPQLETPSISIKPSMLTKQKTSRREKWPTVSAEKTISDLSNIEDSSIKSFYASYMPIFLSGLFLPIAVPMENSLDAILDEAVLIESEEPPTSKSAEKKQTTKKKVDTVKQRNNNNDEASWSSPPSSTPSWVKEKIDALEENEKDKD